ncbi:beta strand repeat-containing protein [Prosthecobacter debontii]|uniref:beta strand repeat-containing protein n=1 Tax=Prosthecobacter debontii TaxID=48467 RepID=UPI001C37C367|nr:autotransporter-associated beta strand repeat-containing protein [Prosthecobacter debontii]
MSARTWLALVVSASLLSGAQRGQAVEATWSGGGANDNWSTGLNWGGAAPVAGDSLLFSGSTRLGPVNDFTADTNFAGITFASGAGAFTVTGNRITLGGNVTNNASSAQILNLALILDATRTFDAASGNLTLGGVISGNGGLIKTGAQQLTLSGSAHNTYIGVTSVTAGTLRLDKSLNINAIAGNLEISSGAKVIFGKSNQLADTTVVTVTGAGSVFNGTAANGGQLSNITETIAGLSVNGGVFNGSAGGNWTITGAGSFTGSVDSTVFVGNSGTRLSFGSLTLTGMTATAGSNVALANSFTLYGNSTTTLSSITVGSGGLTLDGSRFNLRRGGAGALGSRLVLNGNVTAVGTTASTILEDTNGGSAGQVDLELSGTSAAVDRQFTVEEATGSLTISVPITNGASTAAGLIKAGLGSLTLSGSLANTYTGLTRVSAGTLVLNKTAGVNAVAGNIEVATGGTLTLNANEQIADTAGITVSGGTISAWSRTEKIAFYTQTAGGVTGSGNSGQVTITGAMSLLGGNTFTLNSNSGGTPAHFQMDSLIMSGADIVMGGNNGVGAVRTAITVGSGGIQMTGRAINLYRGSAGTVLNLNGDFSGSGNSAIQVGATGDVEPQLNLGTATRTFTIADSSTTTINVGIVGDGGLTKEGNGTLSFTGNLNNTYAGVTTINGGILALNQTSGTDAITNGVDVRTGGTLTLSASEQIADSSGITVNGGSITSLKFTETLSYYTQNSGGFATSGNVGNLIVTGTLTLAGGNTLTMNSSSIPANWDLANAIFSGADMIMGGSNGAANPKTRLTIGNLTLTGRKITMNIGDAGTEMYLNGNLTASGTSSITTGSATGSVQPEVHLGTGTRVFNITSGITTMGVTLMDAAAIQKTGSGVLVLSLPNSYSGGTTISAGAIRVSNTSGSATGTGSLTVASGATLSGAGRVAPAAGGNISISGTVLVGNPSPTQGETLTLVTSGAGAIELLGTVTLDLFSGQGSGTLNGATTADRLVTSSGSNLTLGASSVLNVTTSLAIDAGNSAGWAVGSTWQIFDWSGLTGVTGSFSNLSAASPNNYVNLPNLGVLGMAWDISNLYSAGTITIVAIPEPSRVGFLVLALSCGLIRRRRVRSGRCLP